MLLDRRILKRDKAHVHQEIQRSGFAVKMKG
jgi:hypothetical protein